MGKGLESGYEEELNELLDKHVGTLNAALKEIMGDIKQFHDTNCQQKSPLCSMEFINLTMTAIIADLDNPLPSFSAKNN